MAVSFWMDGLSCFREVASPNAGGGGNLSYHDANAFYISCKAMLSQHLAAPTLHLGISINPSFAWKLTSLLK